MLVISLLLAGLFRNVMHTPTNTHNTVTLLSPCRLVFLFFLNHHWLIKSHIPLPADSVCHRMMSLLCLSVRVCTCWKESCACV